MASRPSITAAWTWADPCDKEAGATGVASQQGNGTIEGQGPSSEAHGAEASASEQQGIDAGPAAQAKGAARSPRMRLITKVRCRAIIVIASGSSPPELVNRACSSFGRTVLPLEGNPGSACPRPVAFPM